MVKRPNAMHNEEILVPLALFAMIFGIIYISVTAKHRQRMAMIDKGMDPGNFNEKATPFRDLRNGLFLVGVGLGLFFGYIMDQNMPHNGMDGDVGDTPLPYFIMVSLFGGAALVAHHLIVRRRQQG